MTEEQMNVINNEMIEDIVDGSLSEDLNGACCDGYHFPCPTIPVF